ncbi:MAG: CDP-alcohol phosphatidyltransferase family protein [Kiritimatiellia bacterium]|jgi:phosphatidylglycerophosphate synthase
MEGKLDYLRSIKPDEPAVVTELIGRRLAHPFAVLAHKLGLSPNAVTVIAGLCWMASTPLAVCAGWLMGNGHSRAGLAVWFFCGFLWNAGYVLDLADGSLARMTGRASMSGFYLDYVFHLLFKPAFLASIGMGLHLAHGGGLVWLLLAVISIPANWSAPASAVEHVLCEEFGKGRLKPAQDDPAAFRALWLGVTEMNESAHHKRASIRTMLRNLVLEIFSYYGQFTFFSVAVLADVLLACVVAVPLPVTSICFVALTAAMCLRIPSRVAREFRRVDAGAGHKGAS